MSFFLYIKLLFIILICIINLILYLSSIYIIKYTQLEDKIKLKFPSLHRILNFYIQLRFILIVSEFILILYCLYLLINLGLKLLTI